MSAYRADTDTPKMECPKCGLTQAEAEACTRCGLLTEFMADFQHEDGSEEMGPMWEELAADWDNEAAHERFLNAVMTAGTYAYAARQYRARLETTPSVQTYLDRIEKMAVLALNTTSKKVKDVPENPYKKTIIVLVILLLLVVGGVLYAGLHTSKSLPGDERARPRLVPKVDSPSGNRMQARPKPRPRQTPEQRRDRSKSREIKTRHLKPLKPRRQAPTKRLKPKPTR